MIEIDWVEIPAGQFQVGCDDWQIFQIRQKLGRAHQSKLDAALQNLQNRTLTSHGFYISRFPITHAQMDEFFKHYPGFLSRRVLPGQDALSSFPEETEWDLADLFCCWTSGNPLGVSPYGVWDMAGNLGEWTMTRRPIRRTSNEGYVVKGNSVWCGKEVGEPLWYYNILAHEYVAGPTATPIYIGFRPIKDYGITHLLKG